RPAHLRACARDGALSTWNPARLWGRGAVSPLSITSHFGAPISHLDHDLVGLSEFAQRHLSRAAVGTMALDDANLWIRTHLRRKVGSGSKNACLARSGAMPIVVWDVRVRSEQRPIVICDKVL